MVACARDDGPAGEPTGPRRPAVRGAAVRLLLLLGVGCAATSPELPRGPRSDSRFDSPPPELREDFEALEAMHFMRDERSRGRREELAGRLAEAAPYLAIPHVELQNQALVTGGDAAAAMRRRYRTETFGDPDGPLTPFLRARIAGDERTRLDLLEEALRRDPRFYPAYWEIGELFRDRDESRAVEAYRQALAARAGYPPALRSLGEVMADLGRLDQAVTYLTDYVRAAPLDAAARDALIRLRVYQLGDTGGLRSVLEADLAPGIPADADDATLDQAMHLAAVDWLEGRYADAAQGYLRVLRARPDHARALLNLGNLYYEPMAAGGEAMRERAWTRARAAYRLFERVPVSGGYDLFDQYLAVPYRLEQIEALLGPPPEDLPSLDDLVW